jgi:hypothetical protein
LWFFERCYISVIALQIALSSVALKKLLMIYYSIRVSKALLSVEVRCTTHISGDVFGLADANFLLLLTVFVDGGDGLRPMTPDQVRVALAGFKYTAPQHCKTDAHWEETSEMIDRCVTTRYSCP